MQEHGKARGSTTTQSILLTTNTFYDVVPQVNETELKDTSHIVARDALSQALSPVKLTVYREKAERSGQKEVHRITLNKVPGVPLGIKIAGRR